MAQKEKVYYRHKTDRPEFKQIIKVLSNPFKSDGGCEKRDSMAVETKVYHIDYNGFKENNYDNFCNFPDDGIEKYYDIIKPIEEVNGKELKDFFLAIFEGKKFYG